MDASFWDEVERCREMFGGEKMSAGLRMRDEWCAQLLLDIKSEFPQVSDGEARRIRTERLDEMTRQRSEEKLRVLELIAAENAAKRAAQR